MWWLRRGWCAAEYIEVVETHLLWLEGQYIIIRDNDPKGYNSILGRKVEWGNAIPVVPLPKRSPDMRAMGYTFHDQIKRQMEARTVGWPHDRVEAVAEYTARLLATYNSLSVAAVNGGCASMRRRLRDVHQAGGHNLKHE